MEKINLETDRLLIRTYESSDALDLHQFVRDNVFFLYETGPMTLKNNITVSKSKAFLELLEKERQSGKWVWNGIFEKETNAFLGQITIYNIEKNLLTCELGYFITVDEMGKGYGTEALEAITQYCFQELDIQRIRLRIKPDNLASKRLAEKLGFQKTGFQKNNFKTYYGYFIDQEVFELSSLN